MFYISVPFLVIVQLLVVCTERNHLEFCSASSSYCTGKGKPISIGLYFCREFPIYNRPKGNVAFIVFPGKFNHTGYGCKRDTTIEPSNDRRRYQISVRKVRRRM